MQGAFYAAIISVPLWLTGCGSSGGKSKSSTTLTTTPTTTTATSTNTTGADGEGSSIWAWRSDIEFGHQTTYDLSGLPARSLFQGCWGGGGGEPGHVDQVGIRNVEDGIKYVEYEGDVGIAMFNRAPANFTAQGKSGCLMRKSRVPLDLSEIGRIELDLAASGGPGGGRAPWYSLWLAPRIYPLEGVELTAKSAEIDLIENYDFPHARVHEDGNNVKTAFAMCDPELRGFANGFCTSAHWDSVADTLRQHVTLTANDTATGDRVVAVTHCQGTGTCTSGPSAVMQATKKPGPLSDWFPIWNRTAAGSHYAHYWLVADIWFTRNTSFSFSASNLKFYFNNGTEFKMPLKGDPVPVATAVAGAPAVQIVI